jgi:hypothetical protein
MRKQSVAIIEAFIVECYIQGTFQDAKTLNPYTEEILGDFQCGFRRDRSTTDQIFALKNVL